MTQHRALLLPCLLLGLSTNRAIGFSSGASQRWRTRGATTRRTAAPPEAYCEGLDAESDSVGPGIYGGNVERDGNGRVVIGQQFEQHNPRPGPVYAGGGYSPMNRAVRSGDPEVVAAVLAAKGPAIVHEVSTGEATPLHMCGMSERAQHATATLVALPEVDLERRDSWGYTPLQRAATNNLPVAAEALIVAGASHLCPSGIDETGESARDLARRLRSFAVLRVFQQWEIAHGCLPEGEMLL